MSRRILLTALAVTMTGAELSAQAVPEDSQAWNVDMGYRRVSLFRVDPFRHAMIPHWGFVFSLGATAENSVLNFADVGALDFLDRNGGLLPGDYIDVVGLIPVGSGVRVTSQAEGGFYLGGPFGGHLNLGFSAQARAYGTAFVADEFVTLIRDGNMTQSDFDLAGSGGSGLATSEIGAHAVLRFGPLGTEDGVNLAVGLGGRLVRAGAYVRGRPSAGSSTIVRATIDSVVADLAFESLYRPLNDVSDFTEGTGGSVVGDFLVRFEWPTSGIAFEAMLANVGSVTVNGVARDTASFFVATSDPRDALPTAFDALNFAAQDTIDVNVKLPRIMRFSAGAWANRILQLDMAATMPVGGEFDTPLTLDFGTTWRFVRHIPLRAGVILGGHQGLGYSGGFAIEARNLFFQVAGQSLGGFFRQARGVGARIDFGVFF